MCHVRWASRNGAQGVICDPTQQGFGARRSKSNEGTVLSTCLLHDGVFWINAPKALTIWSRMQHYLQQTLVSMVLVSLAPPSSCREPAGSS